MTSWCGQSSFVPSRKFDFSLYNRESNAIIQYLVDKYDKDLTISVDGDEKYKQLQWLFFQASGQGYVVPRVS